MAKFCLKIVEKVIDNTSGWSCGSQQPLYSSTKCSYSQLPQ